MSIRVNNYNDLEAYSGTSNDIHVTGEGIAGWFLYVNETLTEDQATMIPATGKGSGYWRRVFTGAPDVKWWGAKGDSVVNDKIAIKTAVDLVVKNYRHLHFSKGVGDYLIHFNNDRYWEDDSLTEIQPNQYRKAKMLTITSAVNDGSGNTTFTGTEEPYTIGGHIRIGDPIFLKGGGINYVEGWYKIVSLDLSVDQITIDVPFNGDWVSSGSEGLYVGGRWAFLQTNTKGLKLTFDADVKINFKVDNIYHYAYDYRNSGLLFIDNRDKLYIDGLGLYFTDVNNKLLQDNSLDANGLTWIYSIGSNDDDLLSGQFCEFRNMVIDFPNMGNLYGQARAYEGLRYSYANYKFENCRFLFGGTETDPCFGAVVGGSSFENCTFDASKRRRSSHTVYWGLDNPDVSIIGCTFRWIGGKADQFGVTSCTDNGTGKVRLNGATTEYGNMPAVGNRIYIELDYGNLAHPYNGWREVIAIDSTNNEWIDIDLAFSNDGVGTTYIIGAGGLAISRRGSGGTRGSRFTLKNCNFFNSGNSWIGYSTGAQYGDDDVSGNNWYDCANVRVYNHENTKVNNNKFVNTDVIFTELQWCNVISNLFIKSNVTLNGFWKETIFADNLVIDGLIIAGGNNCIGQNNVIVNEALTLTTNSPNMLDIGGEGQTWQGNLIKMISPNTTGQYYPIRINANAKNLTFTDNRGYFTGAGIIYAGSSPDGLVFINNHFVAQTTLHQQAWKMLALGLDTIFVNNSLRSKTGYKGLYPMIRLPSDSYAFGNNFEMFLKDSTVGSGGALDRYEIPIQHINAMDWTVNPAMGNEFSVKPSAAGYSFNLNAWQTNTNAIVQNISAHSIDFLDSADAVIYRLQPGEVVEIKRLKDGSYRVIKDGYKINGVWIESSTEKYGSSSFNGDGVTTSFTVTHGAGFNPSQVVVTPTSMDASGSFFISSKTATEFVVKYTSAPFSGTGNVSFDWLVAP